ncbi:hypothetical protein EVAR_50239_1 [Eumeta japonica]|uniref:Secreted protein n=1 Tax=Eumeta variegata TaxID=151549 RepID=A0A4C1YKN4_EUMVA|nr:hypothetical protein EVAR_50239_1 [Eumeta japonica]
MNPGIAENSIRMQLHVAFSLLHCILLHYSRTALSLQSTTVHRIRVGISEPGGEERRVGERNTCAVYYSQPIQGGKVSCTALYSSPATVAAGSKSAA